MACVVADVVWKSKAPTGEDAGPTPALVVLKRGE